MFKAIKSFFTTPAQKRANAILDDSKSKKLADDILRSCKIIVDSGCFDGLKISPAAQLSLAEHHLECEARDDKSFQNKWRFRDVSPKAWSIALDKFIDGLYVKFSVLK
jgi:hypothetical protein